MNLPHSPYAHGIYVAEYSSVTVCIAIHDIVPWLHAHIILKLIIQLHTHNMHVAVMVHAGLTAVAYSTKCCVMDYGYTGFPASTSLHDVNL